MHGAKRLAGAVSGVKTIASPIAAAQAVMNHSQHVMLSGRGAEEFAQQQGLAQVDNKVFNTERRFNALQNAKRVIADSQTQLLEFQDYKFGTVGAVVLDQQGNVVAGTSTGGMTAKRYGRIGDSPIIGAGTFADNNSCAVSATGHGEYFIRYQVAADICARMAYQGLSLQAAADKVINEVLVEADGTGGVIAIDSAGNIAMPFNTEGMYRASIDIHGKMSIAIYR
jgi:L-asparaginase / beta-aspartyl-peptidase